MNKSTALRDQLARLLDWEDAHVDFDNALDGVTRRGSSLNTSGPRRKTFSISA